MFKLRRAIKYCCFSVQNGLIILQAKQCDLSKVGIYKTGASNSETEYHSELLVEGLEHLPMDLDELSQHI